MLAMKRLILAAAGAFVVIVVVGLMLFRWLTPESSVSASDLGITYVQVSPESSCCYGLQPTSGALVTAVTSGSPADQAGIVPGDVITCCNGVEISRQCPLLGQVRICPAGQEISFAVLSSAGDKRTVTLATSIR